MRTPVFILAMAGGAAMMSLAAGRPQAAGPVQPPQTQTPGTADLDARGAVLNRYCITCHNERLKTAGLALDSYDLGNVSAGSEVWEKVVRKVRAGVMPPAGRPRPDRNTLNTWVTSLETALDRAAAAHPNPGRTESVHRLNRTEYQNAIRDLLAVETDVAALLPPDDSSYGFDNIAGVLNISPTLLERYLSAAGKITRVALGRPTNSPTTQLIRLAGDLSQEAHIEGLPWGTRGGTLIPLTLPEDGEYVIKARLARDGQDNIPRYDDTHQLEVTLDGERLELFTLPGEPDTSTPREAGGYRSVRQDVDAHLEVRVAAKAGPREIGVTFLKQPSAQVETVRTTPFSPSLLALKQPFLRPYAGGGGNREEMRSQPYLASVSITGPFNASGADDTPSRRRIFVCRPARPQSEIDCARQILSALARRAYRRPVADADIESLLVFYRQGRAGGTFESGIELALRRLLMNPEFLTRIELDPQNIAPNTPYRLDDLALASRLSFFLWSSIPDDELLDLAVRGRLNRDEVLEQQVMRMLADPRSQAFVSNFTGQWLYLRNLPNVIPNADLFPDFDEALRDAFRRETELFFESIVREDRSVRTLLNANYTFVNERLARHYGIPGVKGSHFRWIALTDDRRRGLLGQGSILTATSYPHRTSPVVRGKWILENLLGTPPPPPPDNVPELKDTNAEGHVLSMRERMVQHRANPVCATCHAMMDPPGLALESFDAVGRWRTRGESFAPIDASGVLPDGTHVDGPAGLREAILNSDLFVTTLTEKLLVYALGRGIESSDAPAVRKIIHEAAGTDYRFSSLLMGLVKSTPFRMRRSLS